MADIAGAMGFDVVEGDAVAYKDDYQVPVTLTCGLIMVPHGKTQSNKEQLFQDHSDNPLSHLLPEGVEMAKKGAELFVAEYGDQLRRHPEAWIFYRTPLSRTTATAECYLTALKDAGIEAPTIHVDPNAIEINQGTWAGKSVDQIMASGLEEDACLARAYRDASFLAKATDGSGESKLDVLVRAAKWLEELQKRHGEEKKNVVVFGHGTFQNCVELLLRCYPEKAASDIFNRNPSGGSHLRRGEAHVLAPLILPDS